MFCPKCGSKNDDNAYRCTQCSTIIQLVAQQPAPVKDIGDDAMMRAILPVGRSGLAIIAGYLGLFSFLIVPAPLSLVVSGLAIRDLKNNPKKHGMGRAIFGLVMGVLGSAVLAMAYLSRGRH